MYFSTVSAAVSGPLKERNQHHVF